MRIEGGELPAGPYTLAIDPGADQGWALAHGGCLWGCGLGDVPRDFIPLAGAATIEHPMVYPGGRTKDPNSIVKLAWRAGETAGLLRFYGWSVTPVLPTQWKGNAPDRVTLARTKLALSPAEAATMARCLGGLPKSKAHNVTDAVGILLWALKRY